MSEAQTSYELMVVLAPQLMEQKKSPKDGVEAVVKRVGGEIVKTDEWGEKTLAYTIDGHDKGYYVVYELKMGLQAHAQMKQKMKLEKGVLRWLLIRNSDK